MKELNKKIIFLLFIIFNLDLNAIKLSEIQGMNLLENYSNIKDIEVNRIVNYGDYKRNKEKNRVYVNGETIPYTGMVIKKKSNRILSFAFYRDGKREGESYSYNINGKLIITRISHNDELVKVKAYHEDGTGMYHFYEQTNGNYGIKTMYYKNNQLAAKMNVKVDYGATIKYINHGETTVYEKNGKTWGILNYKNNKMYGLPQKLFKNGKLKYEYVAASEKGGSNFDAMKYFKEYFDNSDKLKLDCDEQSKGRWHCKEYSKNGKLKNEFTSPTFALQIKRDNSYWTNVFLGIWNILIP